MGGDDRPSEGQVEELNSQITQQLTFLQAGYSLAINKNSLLWGAPRPINVSKAEEGNSDE